MKAKKKGNKREIGVELKLKLNGRLGARASDSYQKRGSGSQLVSSVWAVPVASQLSPTAQVVLPQYF